jgi:putative nucleotide binding protein
MMEESAYVLDYLSDGRPTEKIREPIAYVLGINYFTLLEVSVKPESNLLLEQKLAVGKSGRDSVLRIKRRVSYSDLTSTAKNTLDKLINTIIQEKEQVFVNFINRCGPVTLRLHQLELFPGIGKKHTKEILEERDKEEFKSFEDMKQRLTLFPDPAQMFAHRILMELKGEDKYFLFVKPYHKE